MPGKVIDNAARKRGGLRPDGAAARADDAARRRFAPRMGVTPGTEWHFQAPKIIRDQDFTESCAGQACAAAVDALLPGPPWCSARSLWLDALRREGLPPDANVGTEFAFVLSGLVARGWDPLQPGEDSRPLPTEWWRAESLADEMFAADHRQNGKIERSRVLEEGSDRVWVVAAALADPRLAVVYGGGTTAKYGAFVGDPDRPAQVLGTDFLGGSDGGHARRLLGWYRDPATGNFVFVEQNSWSLNWGGCRLPNGQWLRGCCLVSEVVVIGAWDVHVLELRP